MSLLFFSIVVVVVVVVNVDVDASFILFFADQEANMRTLYIQEDCIPLSLKTSKIFFISVLSSSGNYERL